MKAILMRFMVCALGLGIGSLLYPQAIATGSILGGSIMLALLFIILRPLLQLFILLPNMLFCGLLTPLADALLLLWTSAWIGGIALGYWQAVAISLLMSVLYHPYSLYTQHRLRATADNFS